MREMRNGYWMADSPEEVISRLDQYVNQGLMWSSCPMAQTWVRNHYAYYANVMSSDSWETSLLFDGEQGELVRMMIPEARQLIRQLTTLITKQPLVYRAIAEKRGTDVVMETRLGNALAKDIVQEQDLDQKSEDTVEQALVTGIHFLKATWRTDRGQLIAAQDYQSPLFAGDIDVSDHSVFDVTWDWRRKDWKNQQVVRVRVRHNRWDLAAQHPGLKDEIMALPSAMEDLHDGATDHFSVYGDDTVYVYEVYHAPTAAMPQGRMLIYSDAKTVYYDGINIYGCIPVEPMIPERIGDHCLGYPLLSNLLPCQEMLDHSMSAWATNEAASAVQNFVAARTAQGGVTHEQIAGMNWFTYTPIPGVSGGGKPEGLNLNNTSQHTKDFINVLGPYLEKLSGLNSALRGAPPPGVTSGKAIATLVANAIEFMNSLDKAYVSTMRKVMMHGINGYRRFAKQERLVYLAGPNFETFGRKFVGTDLDPIRHMELTRVNPMMATMSGRMDMAETAIKNGFVKDMQGWISILNGNPVEDLMADELSENDLIDTENERLLDGEPVQVMAHEDHGRHFRKHMALLNDYNVRMESPRAKKILEHAMNHYEAGKTTDPFLMALARTGKIPEGGPPPSGPAPEAPKALAEAGPAATDGENQPAEPADDALGRVA